MRLQFAFSLLWTYFSNKLDFGSVPSTAVISTSVLTSNSGMTNKSIVIVGAGSGGLGMLKALTELPVETKRSLDFILFEEREDVGGTWLPNNRVYYPPDLPETALYPRLHTNAFMPLMTYPDFPPLPNTPLCAHHSYMLSYHQRYASQFNLYRYIAFNHKVLEANWIGTPDRGQWNLTTLNSAGVNETRMVDHLIDATGKDHIPNVPRWRGQEAWLNHFGHELVHSIYYRYPERYANQSVLVVGFGPSGSDIAVQVAEFASKVYVSTRRPPFVRLPFPEKGEWRPEISHFTHNTVVFNDTSEIEVDTVILATGYQVRKPFLEAGNTMIIDDIKEDENVPPSPGILKTNRNYIHPLYKHILSLNPSHPPNALAFVNTLGGLTDYAHTAYVQGLYIINLILNSTLVPTRQEMLAGLEAAENDMRNHGLEPYRIGNWVPRGLAGTSDYQDELIKVLVEKGAIPSTPAKYVAPWRRNQDLYYYGCAGWKRIEDLGQADEWLRGVETEEQWVDLMVRVKDWQQKWENDHNVTFVGFSDEFYTDEYHW